MKHINMIIGGLVVLGFVLINSTFVVQEGERAIVTRFAKVVRNSDGALNIVEPGLHFKVPFIDKIRKLDARIQTLNSTADRFVTSEKKDLIIDSYVKWRIEDFAQYYLSTGGNIMQADELLKKKITNSLRSQIGRLTIKEIVSGKSDGDAKDKGEVDDSANGKKNDEFASKRDEVMQNALIATRDSARDLGIRIVDVRMKQINLPDEVSSSIYQRMRAERNAVAKLHRSQGRQEAETIRANADRRAAVRIAEADRDAKVIRSKGEAQATDIYAKTYSSDPELYDFLRSMEAYKKSFVGGGNVIVTAPENSYLKHFN